MLEPLPPTLPEGYAPSPPFPITLTPYHLILYYGLQQLTLLLVPARLTTNAQLFDFSLQGLTIRANETIHKVPISPPLSSYSDARTRLIEMDTECRTALGIRDQTVKRFTGPATTAHKVVGGLVLFYVLSYAATKGGYVAPGTAAYQILEKFWKVPIMGGGAAGYLKLQEKIVVPLIAIHAVETVVMAWRLRNAGVKFNSGLWWKWIGACTIEGIGAHERVSKEIKANAKERDEKKNH